MHLISVQHISVCIFCRVLSSKLLDFVKTSNSYLHHKERLRRLILGNFASFSPNEVKSIVQDKYVYMQRAEKPRKISKLFIFGPDACKILYVFVVKFLLWRIGLHPLPCRSKNLKTDTLIIYLSLKYITLSHSCITLSAD